MNDYKYNTHTHTHTQRLNTHYEHIRNLQLWFLLHALAKGLRAEDLKSLARVLPELQGLMELNLAGHCFGHFRNASWDLSIQAIVTIVQTDPQFPGRARGWK